MAGLRLGGVLGFFLAGAAAVAMGGCTAHLQIDVSASECINPPNGQCTAGAESRILEVRLYQLKQAVNPCKVNVDEFAQGKDFDALKGSLVASDRKDLISRVFNVEPKVQTVQPLWELARETRYVLAVAIGRGRGKNSVRLLPVDGSNGSRTTMTLHFRGNDICLQPCTVTTEEQCP